MNVKSILDKADKIIKRQDLDRDLLLFFLNDVRQTIALNFDLLKLRVKRQISLTNGVGDISAYSEIKQVEWTDGLKTITLKKILSYDMIKNYVKNPSATGNPVYYVANGSDIQVVPIPTSGYLNIYGNVIPTDLTDSELSSDFLTNDIPAVITYMTVAEYFDMLGEENKGNVWRQKGQALLGVYIKKQKINETDDLEMLSRDPFGNLTDNANDYSETEVDILDGGVW